MNYTYRPEASEHHRSVAAASTPVFGRSTLDYLAAVLLGVRQLDSVLAPGGLSASLDPKP